MSAEKPLSYKCFLLTLPVGTTSETAARSAAKISTLSDKNIRYRVLGGEVFVMNKQKAIRRYPKQYRLFPKVK